MILMIMPCRNQCKCILCLLYHAALLACFRSACETALLFWITSCKKNWQWCLVISWELGHNLAMMWPNGTHKWSEIIKHIAMWPNPNLIQISQKERLAELSPASNELLRIIFCKSLLTISQHWVKSMQHTNVQRQDSSRYNSPRGHFQWSQGNSYQKQDGQIHSGKLNISDKGLILVGHGPSIQCLLLLFINIGHNWHNWFKTLNDKTYKMKVIIK